MISNPVICEFDQTSHISKEDLHLYLRRFRIKQEVYYHQYNPRHDLLTGELIPYKDYDQYHTQSFINKINLKKWLKTNPEKGLQWAIDWLREYKMKKCLEYAPSQVELRTMVCPSMPYYDKVGHNLGGYYGITKSLGYTARYQYHSLKFTDFASDAIILQDTREQLPLKLSIATKRETVNVGDYALAPPYDEGVRIERKSLSDMCGTLSGRQMARKDGADSAFNRFDRELARAKEANLYVVMIVESDINEAQSFNYLPHMKHIKASPSYLMHNLRELLSKYPLSFQTLFVSGRVEAAKKLIRILQLGAQVETIDLQMAYEKGEL